MSIVTGYARVAQSDQGQVEAALRAAGAVRVFVDRGGTSPLEERMQWLACLESLHPGDALLVPRLDCLGGSERLVVEALTELHHRGADITSLSEPAIDTTSPSGRALYDIAEVLARVRTDGLREKTREGLERARSAGRVGGRPSVMTPARLREARRLRGAGRSLGRIADDLGVGKSSVARALAKDSSVPGQQRVFYRDVKPFEAPDSLDALDGPSGGLLELPHHLHWAPESSVDLTSPGGLAKAYQAILTEGGAIDQVSLLNRRLLVAAWPSLTLPDRVRLLWEDRFPELLDRG